MSCDASREKKQKVVIIFRNGDRTTCGHDHDKFGEAVQCANEIGAYFQGRRVFDVVLQEVEKE